ncbi:MAG: TIGR04255 family protein [Gammaproteobacteria bacterium]
MPLNSLQKASLGHLARAPLVYTLGLVEYSQIPKMDSYAPDILEKLRSDYPEVKQIEFQTWNINLQAVGQTAESQLEKNFLHSATTADKKWGVVFDKQRFVLHTRDYEHYPDFAQRFENALKIVTNVAKITHSRRMGIRYVDNIRGLDSTAIDKQVRAQFLTPILTDWLTPKRSFIEHLYQSDSGQLVLRCVLVSEGSGIPPDLMVTANALFNGQSPVTPINELFMLVDTDHSFDPGSLQLLDIPSIMKRLETLHDGASMAFRELVTPEAIELWRKK